MAEEKKEGWLNWLAVTTIIFSACATLATFKGGGLSTRAILAQSSASDTWAYYQAKSIKEHSFELQRESLQLQSIGTKGEQAEAYKAKIADYDKEIARYQDEKKKIEAEAKAFEAIRNDAQKTGGNFGLAIPFLQVAIMLSALSALMKKQFIWAVGAVLGLVGLVYFANGFLLFF
jgi:hypothetical protein